MKYAFLICDGASDWSIPQLDGKTVFEYANTPYMDVIATKGKMGQLKTVPDGMQPGSECANMLIMGYRPEVDLTGRGPLEALSAGVDMTENDICFRCNLITIEDGKILDYSSGHITTGESTPLMKKIQINLGSLGGNDGVDFFPGVQYRHILRMDGEKYSEDVVLAPPHDHLGEPYQNYLAQAKDPSNKKAKFTAQFINEMIEQSNSLLIDHEINQKREKQGKRKATHIWPWSGGKKPDIRPFREKYGLTGSVISAVDLIFGIGVAAGLEPIHVEGATGLPDTNYDGKVQSAIEQLREKDFVYLHVEATDEMGHGGDPHRKVAALEDFDKKIVKPILEAEESFNNQLVVVVLPDHPTPVEIRTHSKEPVPFGVYVPKNEVQRPVVRKFSEENGKKGELGLIENGEAFMLLIIEEAQKGE